MSKVFRPLLSGAAAALLLLGGAVSAQQPSGEDRVAALKSSLASSKAVLRQYEWIETTVVNLKAAAGSVTCEAGKCTASAK